MPTTSCQFFSDYFNYKTPTSLNGQVRHTSCVTQSISLLIFILAILLSYFQIEEMIYNLNPLVTTSFSPAKDSSSIQFSPNDFNFAFNAISSGNSQFQLDSTYLTPNVYLYTPAQYDENGALIDSEEMVELGLVECEDGYFVDSDETDGWCIAQTLDSGDALQLFVNSDTRMILSLGLCDGDTNDNCKEENEVEEALLNSKLYITLTQALVDPQEYENPIQMKEMIKEFSLDQSVRKLVSVELQKVSLEGNSGWTRRQSQEFEATQISAINYDFDLQYSEGDIFRMEFKPSQFEQEHKRGYKQFGQSLAEIVSIIIVFVYFLKWFLSPYVEKGYYQNLIEKNYDFNTGMYSRSKSLRSMKSLINSGGNHGAAKAIEEENQSQQKKDDPSPHIAPPTKEVLKTRNKEEFKIFINPQEKQSSKLFKLNKVEDSLPNQKKGDGLRIDTSVNDGSLIRKQSNESPIEVGVNESNKSTDQKQRKTSMSQKVDPKIMEEASLQEIQSKEDLSPIINNAHNKDENNYLSNKKEEPTATASKRGDVDYFGESPNNFGDESPQLKEANINSTDRLPVNPLSQGRMQSERMLSASLNLHTVDFNYNPKTKNFQKQNVEEEQKLEVAKNDSNETPLYNKRLKPQNTMKPTDEPKISFCQYLRTKLLGGGNKDQRLFQEGINQINGQLDITNMINKLREIDRLKAILLDDHQRVLFDFLPKPPLKFPHEGPIYKKKNGKIQKSQSFRAYMRTINSINKEISRESAFESFIKIKDRKQKSPIDGKILFMYEELFGDD